MVKLKGSKKDGYIIEVKDGRYIKDIQLHYEELLELYNKIKAKIK